MRLIDAKAMEKQAKESFKENPFLMGILLRWIRKQPTIEAEPVNRGRWELWGDEIYMAFKCSVCGVEIDEDYYNVAHTCCPNCGAKMDEEGEA